MDTFQVEHLVTTPTHTYYPIPTLPHHPYPYYSHPYAYHPTHPTPWIHLHICYSTLSVCSAIELRIYGLIFNVCIRY